MRFTESYKSVPQVIPSLITEKDNCKKCKYLRHSVLKYAHLLHTDTVYVFTPL